jgi:glycosyltransferase involved in cell wall biosynthesis
MNDLSKRLAVLLPDMVVGGAQRSMLKLAGGIAARGYPIDLVLSSARGPFLAEVPESVRVVDLHARRVLTSLPALIHYLRREQPAALLSVLHANIVALWATRLGGVPTRLVVSERNTLSSESRNYSSDLRMRLSPKLVKRFYPWADAIVAVSKGVAHDLTEVAGIPRERIRVIYNPIVTPEFRKKAEALLDHPWFGPGQPPVIVTVGRLSVQKDFSSLIQAFARVRRTRRARLLILGEGDERAALEAQVKQFGLEQDVGLPGFVANPYPYMSRAGVFVLSSRWEGLPGVLIEALYCGTPLVATDCPSGPREILADGQYGQLVPVGDTSALAEAIEIALNGDVPRPPRESWRPFELEVVVSEYLDVLLDKN